ncbi:MAG: GNAT family N-acetyltransferase [Brevundimonas sp.]|uniref:GNAT family N-acetyltransferase n=1 Tax=Brevundimonas sp. TaxID=1871086 RepID=UPI002567F287|nr:GNAT family N-acetyltransferase [Brevundimonas sp.]MDK2747399.1 GNAT family N-acetyltransferase [Brevundimonas sp.]
MAIIVQKAGVEQIDALVPLFDAYRQFYRRPSAPDDARVFLLERMERQQSVVFLAFDGAVAVGFVQMFPSFSSAAMRSILILNDLFVAHSARGTGVGRALLDVAASYGRQVGAARLTLSTENTNTSAQAIYEHMGWTPSTDFQHYNVAL